VYVAAAVVVPVVVMSSSGVSLPHYRYVWLAPFLLLAALGLDRAWSSGGWRRVGAIALAVPLAVAGVVTTWRVTTLEPSDYRRAAMLIREAGLEDGTVLAHGQLPIFRGELPDTDRVRLPEVAASPPDVVIVDRLYERRHPRPEVRDVARSLGLERVQVDRLDLFLPPDAAQAVGRSQR
jgi:hypothetical protein